MIFNIIAQTVKKLFENTNIEFFEEYQAISDNIHNSLEFEISTKIPLLIPNKTYIQFNENNMYDSCLLCNQIQRVIDEYIQSSNYIAIMKILQIIDTALSEYIENLSNIIEDYRYIDYLNQNWKTTNIIILPKYSVPWQHDSMWKAFEYNINNYLFNILIIDSTTFISRYKINNYVIKNTMFSEAKKRKKLIIGMAPVINKKVLPMNNIEFSDNSSFCSFNINHIEYVDEIYNNIISNMKLAKQKRVDILLFPEILGQESYISKFNKYCYDNMINGYDSEDLFPEMIVFPSIWKNQMNQAPICIGENNRFVYQNKFFRFPYQSEKDNDIYLENIKAKKPYVINVFHVQGIGRIVIAICKDILIKEYVDMLIKDFRASLVLVPSFSISGYPFKMIFPIGYPYDCNIAWVNSCAAQQEDDKMKEVVAMVSHPNRKISCSLLEQFSRKENCNNNCSNCVFTYEMDWGE